MSEVSQANIFDAIEKISSQNPINKEETKEIIGNAIKKAFHNKYNPDAELEIIIDEDKKVFKLFNNSKLVVPDNEFEASDENERAINIPLQKARKINPKVQVDELVREEVEFALYARTISQQIKQIITQTIRERKKEAIFTKYKDLKGKMIDVTVSSIAPNFVIFQLLDKEIAFMPDKFRNPKIPLAVGQKTRVYIEDILEDSKDSQIIVSNGSIALVKRALEFEVPEIASGIVEIMSIARQPGIRSKVAIKSNSSDVDPVGTIIGAGGNRINAIIDKLEGEKIDIILHSDDPKTYIANALSPARVVSICEKHDSEDNVIENQCIAVVPNSQLTLAIGKKGSNAKLAVELTKMRIDVISIDQAKERGIEFQYNVGLTAQDAIDIDNGIYIGNNFAHHKKSLNRINNDDFDNSIASFKETITKEETTKNNFDIDDDLFSDQELRNIESAFENDDLINDSSPKDDENS